MSEGAARDSGGRRNGKSAAAFRTISEVASELDVPSHVLRFWETKFSQVRPLKRGGGRRYYRPEDVELLRRIRSLLYDDGYTIKGVQKLLRQGGLKNGEDVPANKAAAAPVEQEPASENAEPVSDGGLRADQRKELSEILAELEALRDSTRNI